MPIRPATTEAVRAHGHAELADATTSVAIRADEEAAR
jgi:hypothetical protein